MPKAQAVPFLHGRPVLASVMQLLHSSMLHLSGCQLSSYRRTMSTASRLSTGSCSSSADGTG